MRFVEAVNWIEKCYGMQAFDHIEDYADDEAVQILLEERKRSSSKANKKSKRGKNPGAATLRNMIENGYTYVEMAMATGLSSAAVGKISGKYGLRELYYKMHPMFEGLMSKCYASIAQQASKWNSKPCQPLSTLLDCPTALCQNGQKTGELLYTVTGK